MKINVEETVIVEDVEVEVCFAKDDDGIIRIIDFVEFCPECGEGKVVQRFLPVSEEELQEMLEEEEYDDFDDDGLCCCDDCIERRRGI